MVTLLQKPYVRTYADGPVELVKTEFDCTVKLVYNDQPWDPKIGAVVDRWSLFRGNLML